MSAGRGNRTDGRQLRWQQHNRERRQVILDAAVAVLERHPAGAEIHVQEIAEQAGLSRTVVYRHFQDRGDLDIAVQRDICARLGVALLPSMSFDGTPREIIHRIVGAFVHWAVDHPALLRFAERDLPGTPAKPMDEAIEQIAQQIEAIMTGVVSLLGAELTERDRDGLVPWVFGLIGGCFYAVRRWTSRERLAPSPDAFVQLLSDAMWFQIDGLASTRGIELPDLPVEELLAGIEAGPEASPEAGPESGPEAGVGSGGESGAT
jgi:AcrR family transcriptional regulator